MVDGDRSDFREIGQFSGRMTFSRRAMMVLVTYNSDLGDAWEWMDQPCYPELYSGQVYRMGINFMIYAMSH